MFVKYLVRLFNIYVTRFGKQVRLGIIAVNSMAAAEEQQNKAKNEVFPRPDRAACRW